MVLQLQRHSFYVDILYTGLAHNANREEFGCNCGAMGIFLNFTDIQNYEENKDNQKVYFMTIFR